MVTCHDGRSEFESSSTRSENQPWKPKKARWHCERQKSIYHQRKWAFFREFHYVFIHRYCKLKKRACMHVCMHTIPLYDTELHATTLHDIELHCIRYIHPYGYYSVYHVIMLRRYIYIYIIAKQVFTCIKRYICVATGPPQTHPATFSTGTQKGPFRLSKHCSSW